MRAIILAAGRGSRMKGLTAARPKCLVELAGQSLIEWQTRALRATGVEAIALVTGYRAELLAGRSDKTFHNSRWAETNMVATLCCAAEWLRAEPCIISYADIVYHPDIVRALMDTPQDLRLTYDILWRELWEDRFDNPLGDAESFHVNTEGKLTDIGQNADNMDDIQGQYMGLLQFTPGGWKQIEASLSSLAPAVADRVDMTSMLSGMLRAGAEIAAVPVRGRWCEADDEEDVKLYERKLGLPARWTHDWRW